MVSEFPVTTKHVRKLTERVLNVFCEAFGVVLGCLQTNVAKLFGNPKDILVKVYSSGIHHQSVCQQRKPPNPHENVQEPCGKLPHVFDGYWKRRNNKITKLPRFIVRILLRSSEGHFKALDNKYQL